LDGLRYATSPDALPAPEDAQPTKVYNLQGRLVSGSMQYRLNPCEFRFRVAGALKEVEVHYAACVLPDTVRDLKGKKVEITAHGTLSKAGHFQARDVIGKCPSKDGYEADLGKRPELIEPTRID
jgi:cytochrome c-type biogenesis protein CcmE